MAISTKNFSTLVANMVAAVQGQATALIDFNSGGIIRSLIEAVAGLGLWLQSLVLQVAALTRLSTSSGADVDSFVNDFGFRRGGAVAAVASVTFSRYTDTAQAVIQPGAQVGTQDGTQSFTVTQDLSNPAWSNTFSGYLIPASVASVSGIPVQANAPGSAGNVVAGSISLLLTAVPGVDNVTNPAPAAGGADAESDVDVKTGFVNYLASLRGATVLAIETAVASVQAGLSCNIGENVNPDGSAHQGYLTITVDDGTGSPSTALLQSIYTAVDAVRAAGVGFGVFAPTTVTANAAMTITAAMGYSGAILAPIVQAAVSAYISSLTLGESLPYAKLEQVAFDASPGVANVTAYTLNSGTADLDITGAQKIICGTVAVSH